VGKKRLEKAISLYHKTRDPTAEFNITWSPYYLDPAAPKVGMDKTERYIQKFRDPARVKAMQARLGQIGGTVGIKFNNGGKTGNTRDSHRLVQLGKTKSEAVQTRVVEELFAGYFENEEDITSKEFLLRAGVKAGLKEAEVKDWLDSDKGGKEVDEEVDSVASWVRGVPNFTIQGKYQIDGAQEPEEFLEVFNAIADREARAA
jgi:predicted DsbA family dithiol-disulfide isomerase